METFDWKLATFETTGSYRVASMVSGPVIVCVLSLLMSCDRILAAYRQYGVRFVEKMRRLGPCSGIIWNTETSEYLVFRDIFGFMPWMVADGEDGVISLTSSPEVHERVTAGRSLNRVWLGRFLREQDGLSLDDVLVGTRRMLPGDVWIYHDEKSTDITRIREKCASGNGASSRQWTKHNYWEMREYRWLEGDFESLGLAFGTEIMQAVSRIPASDPLFTLSGGLDSTGILASWIKQHPQKRAHAFSLISRAHASCDESEQLNILENRFPIDLTRLNMDDALTMSRHEVYETCRVYGPAMAPGTEYMLMMYDVMAQKYGPGTVITGFGGNHIVNVYKDSYIQYVATHLDFPNLKQFLNYFSPKKRSLWRAILGNYLGNIGDGEFRRWFHWFKRCSGGAIAGEGNGFMSPLLAAQVPAMRTNPFFKRSQFDKWCWNPRCWSWELKMRALDRIARQTKHHFYDPLYDPCLYDFCAQVPPTMMVYDGKSRQLYREALRPLLPEEILNHPKVQHFDDAIHSGLRCVETGRFFEEEFRKKRCILADLLDTEALKVAYRRYLSEDNFGSPLDMRLWRGLCACLWIK